MCDIKKSFELVSDDYLKFDLVANKLSQRPDIHAFILLDSAFPNNNVSIVMSASHDEICLDVGSNSIKRLTRKQILELVRCGVSYNVDNDSLFMFV